MSISAVAIDQTPDGSACCCERENACQQATNRYGASQHRTFAKRRKDQHFQRGEMINRSAILVQTPVRFISHAKGCSNLRLCPVHWKQYAVNGAGPGFVLNGR